MKRSFETQNVIIWLGNDLTLYEAMRHIVSENKEINYVQLISQLNLTDSKTPDGVSWLDPAVDFEDLNLFVSEIGSAS